MPGDHTRHLSATEVITDLLHAHGASTVVHVACFHSDDLLSENDINRAWGRLVEHQPALRVGIRSGYGQRGVSKMFTEVDCSNHRVPLIEVQDWMRIIFDELNHPLAVGEDIPLWKAWMCRITRSGFGTQPQTGISYVIVFKVHHVIADHVSVFRLLTRQFLQVLDRGRHTEKPNTRLSFPAVLMPSVDMSFLVNTTPSSRLKGRRGRSIKPRHRSASAPRRPDKSETSVETNKRFSGRSTNTMLSVDTMLSDSPAYSVANRTNLRLVSLGVAEASRLARTCREYGVSPLDVVTTAACTAYCMVTKLQRVLLSSSKVHCCSWLSLRGLHSSRSQVNALGMWECPVIVKLAPQFTTPRPRAFWDIAKDVSHFLAPTKEPWQRPFAEYKNALDDVNKLRQEDMASPVVVKVPRAHFECAVLAPDAITRHPEVAGYTGSLEPSTLGSSSSSFETRSSSSRPERDELTSLGLDEYYAVTSVGRCGASPLKLSLCLLEAQGLHCAVTWNKQKIRDEFAGKFLDVTCNLLKTMTSRQSMIEHHGIEKLPPLVRATLLRR